MKKLRVLMGALVLAVAAATIIACNKEKETNVAQQATETEEVVRKPIATYDNVTGKMTYHISGEYLQDVMDKYTALRGEDEYVIESWQISEEENEIQPVFRYTVVNTETESSSSVALFGNFVEKVVGENRIDYFIAENILSGNYSFVAKGSQTNYLITVVDGEILTIDEYDQPAKNRTLTDYQIICEKKPG